MVLLQEAKQQVQPPLAHVDDPGHATVERVAVVEEGQLLWKILINRAR